MDFVPLIPTPDTIPAPSWVFLVLNILTFTLHLVVVNVILGGSLIMLVNRFRTPESEFTGGFSGTLIKKIPTSFAIGVNLGVAPLLFLQVIYGHLFYTSSVLMAVYWILIIPLLIIGYYGAYIHSGNLTLKPLLSKFALLITVLVVLYIAFIFVNNLTLMTQPEKWSAYFANRDGTILNLSDPTLIPRYLHFVAASVAIAGLFIAIIWHIREKKGIEKAATHIDSGLKIFGYATILQVLIGLWFLIAIPREFMLQFMGGNRVFTIIFMLGFLSGIGAIATAFAKKLRPTIIMLVITIIFMVLMRHNLRTLYLDGKFDLSTLQLDPQYGVLILFIITLLLGLGAVAYMLKAAFIDSKGRTA